ncbi:MAG: class I SAM-dependent methyltransferase [Anaerolineaceae bacterium]
MKNDAPLKEQQHVIDAFTDLAPNYEKKMDSELNLFWGWSYRELIEILLENCKDIQEKRILDLATGKLIIPRAILSFNPAIKQIVGLDITYRMLDLGKATLSKDSLIQLLCASALEIPICSKSFDLVTCALATHHMDVKKLLSEIHRILDLNGDVMIVDVGASKTWMNPIVRFFIRILAFLYFLVKENMSRAWAESEALPNIRTAENWTDELKKAGFQEIKIKKLKSRRPWIPDPILIQAKIKGDRK